MFYFLCGYPVMIHLYWEKIHLQIFKPLKLIVSWKLESRWICMIWKINGTLNLTHFFSGRLVDISVILWEKLRFLSSRVLKLLSQETGGVFFSNSGKSALFRAKFGNSWKISYFVNKRDFLHKYALMLFWFREKNSD